MVAISVGCGTSTRGATSPSTTSGAPRTTSAVPQSTIYLVSEASGWTLREASNPTANDAISSRAEPTLDWSSKYELAPDPNNPQSVRLSGHNVSIAVLEATLVGFQLRTEAVTGADARVGAGPDGPRVVLLPVSPTYTIMALSYELDDDELVAWAKDLKPATETEWVARGGVIAK